MVRLNIALKLHGRSIPTSLHVVLQTTGGVIEFFRKDVDGYNVPLGSNSRLPVFALAPRPALSSLGKSSAVSPHALTVGLNFACNILVSGRVSCYGSSLWGNLGYGVVSSYSAYPVNVLLPEDAAPVVRVAVGHAHSLFLLEDGTVYAT